ncbi:MAG TPA: hypothetical protein VGC51_00485 [Hansschlegelia sp.]
MPSLMRFITLVAVVGAVGFGAIYALATFVSPRTREMTVTIPAARLKGAPPEAAATVHPKTAGAEAAAESATSAR